ncbi:MAG TPA: hypothetical protein VM097_00245 [Mycobacteriales bacterium]|nr:hypothetical protein [Mycobacteriales bacterium]
MRKAHQVLAYLLAAEVVIQAMAIAYALAGLGYWVMEEGGVLTKQLIDDEDLTFQGVGGFAIHGMNGMMIIPLLGIVFLVVSLLANKQVPGAAKRGGIIFGLLALQVFLGLTSHSAVLLAPLHALNGFGIFTMCVVAARKAAAQDGEPALV